MPNYECDCSKCGKDIGLAYFQDSDTEYATRYLANILCEECTRVKAWLPEIVAAVVAALRELPAQPVVDK